MSGGSTAEGIDALLERLHALTRTGQTETLAASSPSAILQARARLLASPLVLEREQQPAVEIEVLVVQVGAERMGVPLERIAAVARANGVTPLPRTTLPVYGVTAWRGRPLTVLILGTEPPAMSEDTRIVVLGDGRRAVLAVLVEAVHDVECVALDALGRAGTGGRATPVLGVTPDAMSIVDASALLGGVPDAT